MAADITKQSPKGLKGLKYRETPYSNMTNEEIDSLRRSILTGRQGPSVENTSSFQPYSLDTKMGSYGTSKYDNTFENQPLSDEQVQEARYENQPWYDTLANGVGKMLGTAGTTFVSSLVGLPYGLYTAANEGRWSGLWDNSVTQGLADVDKWLEDNMTNYKSQKQQNSPWYDPSNLFSMNFLADDIIKNAGFTLGAAASMAVGSGSLGLMNRAMGFVNDVSKGTKMTNNVLSALFSATGEGMIEARQGVDERNKLETQKLMDALAPEKQALEEEFNQVEQEYAMNRGKELRRGADGRAYDPAYAEYSQRMKELQNKRIELQQREAAGKQQIEESGREMGNKILLANQALLTTGNLIQFGKAMTKSFDNARHAAEVSSKSMKPSWLTDGFAVVRKNKNNIREGYELTNKRLGQVRAATKGMITEGSEEMNQQWIQSSSGAAYNEKDVNDYWKARLNQDSYRETAKGLYTIGNILGQGFEDSWGDINQWEQFVIGGLTGMAGSYSPTKLFNQDKTKSRLDPRRYGSWEGGVYNTVRDFNKQYSQAQENIDDLNKALASEDFQSRLSSLAAHTYTEKRKANSAAEDDKKAWKDEDDKQTIHDIQAFLRAGKLDDLRAIYDEMGKNLSDEDVENIVKSTTREISTAEDKKHHDDAIDEQIARKQRRINALQSQIDTINESAELLEGDEDSWNTYAEAAGGRTSSLYAEIAKESKDIMSLEEEKKNYDGRKTYEGAFVNSEGNQIKTNDEIREEVSHNSKELQRKLDSYLESIATVNKMTGGQLTKDQEDNLAYLHNLSKEKIERFNKIMANVRKSLPNKFLLKTNKSVEQLAKENASSDLAFTKDDSTPEGYVEVDTSLMNDKAFGNFFMDTVMYGNNIQPEVTEEEQKANEEKSKEIQEQEKKVKEAKNKVRQAAVEQKAAGKTDENQKKIDDANKALEAEEKALKDLQEKQEKEKTAAQKAKEKKAEEDTDEQQRVNVERYKKNFYDTMRQNTNMTLEEIRDAFEDMKKDIYEASVIRNESQEFFNTYLEYMANPGKVEEDKAKEEKKVTEQQEKKNVQELSTRELAQRTDLKELLEQAKKDSDIALINKIKRAMLIRQQQAKTSSAGRDSKTLSGYAAADKDAAIQAQLEKLTRELDSVDTDERELSFKELADRISSIDEQIVRDAIRDNLSPADDARLAELEATNKEAFDKEMEERVNTVMQAVDDLDAYLMSQIPDIDESRIDASDEALADLADRVREENPPSSNQKRDGEDTNPVISVPSFDTEAPQGTTNGTDSVHDESALEGDMQMGTEGVEFERSGQHPWRIVTRRVGYHTNKPYSETLQAQIDNETDATKKAQLQKQLRRVKAVEKILESTGAFTRVESGQVKRNNTVKFKILKSVNDEALDFVIFMTDAAGNIIGDLPSNDPDIEPSTSQITGLSDLYEEAHRQWDALDDSQKANPDGFILEGLETNVDYTYFGKVRYQDTRQSVNELFGDEEFTLAIRVGEKNSTDPASFLDTGKQSLKTKLNREATRPPLTGTKGQPYVLIPTSKAKVKNNFNEGYLAVPILTPQFGELSKDSMFYRVVKDILERIRDGKIQNTQAKEMLSVLFGVDNVHVNFEGDITKRGSGITITTFSRRNQSEKGNAFDVFKGNREDLDVDAALGTLGRFFINISNKKINTSDVFYTLNGEKISYNRMIGEIATTNAAMPHTVNDFFTVIPLEKKDGKFSQVAQKPARMKLPHGNMNSIFHVKVKYKDGTMKMWSIDPSENFICRDEQGRPIYKEDNVHTASEKKLAAQYRAEAFGRFFMKDFSRPFAIMIDNVTYSYDPTTRTFKSVKEYEKTAPRYDKAMSDYDYMTEMLETIADAQAELDANRGMSNSNAQEDKVLKKAGKETLNTLEYKVQDRHSNGHVRGGQSGWKLRFIIRNPKTGKAFTQEEVNSDKKAYLAAAMPLLNWLKEYFSNPDGTDKISTSKPQSDYNGYAAHYHFTDSNGKTREPFKFLTGGEVGESDFTIYIGSMADVSKFMSDVQSSPINDLLAEGNNNSSDTTFSSKIHGRIEGRSIGFSGYMLPEGLQKIVPNFSTVYEDDRVEISINDGEYLVKDKKTGKYHGVNFTAADSKDSAIGYVADNIVKIRNKIAENIYGEYITGKTIEKTSEAEKQENIKRVNATISKLQTDGAKFVVCDVNGNPNPNGDYYKDENGVLYARVTSMAEGDPYVEPFKEKNEDGTDNPWILPSTTIGNQVDELIRRFFEGEDFFAQFPVELLERWKKTETYEEVKGDPDLEKVLNALPDDILDDFTSLEESTAPNLLVDLSIIRRKIESQGWKVASRDIVASGVLGVTDNNGDKIMVRVAGTLDLLLYNPEKDEYAIYDIKTHRSSIDFSNAENDSHYKKWQAQLSLYKEMLEIKYPEMKGKIKGLKIIPFKVDEDSYDANKHTYHIDDEGYLFNEAGEAVSAEVAYDGQTIPIKERILKIDMGKNGFKETYNTEEGKKQIIVAKPRPKPAEAPKQKVKEGLVKMINKIAADRPMSRYLKESYKQNKDAQDLCNTIDEARKNGTLADLMLTEATMSMLSDMLNEKLINNHAAQAKMNLEGLGIPNEKPADEAKPKEDTQVAPPETVLDVEEAAKKKGILTASTQQAWNRLTDENKQKAVRSGNTTQLKRALQDAQRLDKDPNQAVGRYLHRKAVETQGYPKLDMEKELGWLNRVLPQLSQLNKTRIIEGLIRCSDGTWDYGNLRNGLLYLGTDGKEGTVYHEAFHAVTQWILTDAELDALYDAARERYGDLDAAVLEEKMADDFMLYTMGGRPSYKQRHLNIFQRLWKAIKKMLGKTSMIDKLYRDINDGVYAGAVLRNTDNAFSDVSSEDREVSMEYNFLDNDRRNRLQTEKISKKQYDVLDNNEKRYLFHCVI